MSSYDENLFQNQFFSTLRTKYSDLWKSAIGKKLTILVPQRSAVPSNLSEQLICEHILDADPEQDGLYYNLKGKEVWCCENRITLCSKIEGELYQSADILFEETFFTQDDRSYRVICISQMLTLLREDSFGDSSLEDCPPSTSVTKLPPVSPMSLDTESADFCHRVLFGAEKDFRLETRLQNGCLNFARKLNRDYKRCWNAKMVTQPVITELKSMLRLVLKRKRHIQRSKIDPRELDCLKLATEIYFFSLVGKSILSLLRGCFVTEDSELNRAKAVAERLTPQQLAVNPRLYDSMPSARKELSGLNDALTPHARLLCLRRTIVALSSGHRKTSANNDSNGKKHISSDDLLPAIVYLVIRCTSINDWSCNLCFLSDFHFSKAAGDELGYCLASFEAATHYIKEQSLRDAAIESEINIHSALSLSRQSSTSDDLSDSETQSLRDYVVELIRANDDVVLVEFYQQQLAVAELQSLCASPESGKCHPLCSCPQCNDSDDVSNSRDAAVLNPDTPLTSDGRTALHLASLLGKTSIINALMKAGANPDVQDEKLQTPLHLASFSGSQSCTLLLLHLGASINVRDVHQNTPLHIACYFGHVDCVKSLVYFDQQIKLSTLDINSINSVGDTALHVAVKFQHSEIATVLMEAGILLELRNDKKETASDLCNNAFIQQTFLNADSTLEFEMVNSDAFRGATDALSLISDDDFHSVKSHQSVDSDENLGFYSPKSGSKASWSAEINIRTVDRMLRAVADNDVPMVKFYIGEIPQNQGDCHPLCQCEKCKKVAEDRRELIDVNVRGSSGRAALHAACQLGDMEMVRLLLKSGADVNILSANSLTPLHVAVRENHTTIVRSLVVDWSANLEVPDSEGNTVLHCAAVRGQQDLLKILCQLGADTHAVNGNGESALHLAVKGEQLEMIETLLVNGASPFLCNAVRLMPVDLTTNPQVRKLLERFE